MCMHIDHASTDIGTDPDTDADTDADADAGTPTHHTFYSEPPIS